MTFLIDQTLNFESPLWDLGRLDVKCQDSVHSRVTMKGLPLLLLLFVAGDENHNVSLCWKRAMSPKMAGQADRGSKASPTCQGTHGRKAAMEVLATLPFPAAYFLCASAFIPFFFFFLFAAWAQLCHYKEFDSRAFRRCFSSYGESD